MRKNNLKIKHIDIDKEIDNWLCELSFKKVLADNTINSYFHSIKTFVNFIKDNEINPVKLNQKHIDRFFNSIRKSNKMLTI